MAKKTNTIQSLLEEAINNIQNSSDVVSKNYIPSIIEFCESEKYLDFRRRKIELYPVQKLILRAFYRGSRGNTSPDSMNMTEEEIELCKKLNLNGSKNGNILQKWNSNNLFLELLLVCGRRSGKDFLASIIALYECMRLLETDGGNPYEYYNLDDSNPIVILTIANAQDQAGQAFREIYGKVIKSPYFQDKIVKEGIGVSQINFLTPYDKETNKKLKQDGLPLKIGSVQIETGHSNSASLVGKSCFMIIFDEMAKYKQTNSASSGDQLWSNLTPTVRTYNVKRVINGVSETQYDGKIVCISTPEGEDGIFYDLYKNTDEVEHRIMFKLPTWEVNLRHTKEGLRKMEKDMTEDKFMREYGAEFSGIAGQSFFTQDVINECFDSHNFQFREFGEPGYLYFAHLDPAIKSDNYALVIVHKHYFLNSETGKLDFWIVLDHAKVWIPKKNKPVNIEEVDSYIIDLYKKFRIGLVTYDQMFSHHSIEKLTKYGIPAKKYTYNQRNKMTIYNEFLQLAARGKVKLPYLKLLKDEMIHLQKKSLGNGFKVGAKRDGDITTDDLIDALCGATFHCNHSEIERLPKTQLAYLPSGSINNRVWNTMSGTLGYGTGQQVADFLAKHGNK